MPSVLPRRLTPTLVHRRIGLLSTYHPQRCGLATFSAALATELRRAGSHVDLVRIVDGSPPAHGSQPVEVPQPAERSPGPCAELVNGVPASVRAAAAVLSRCDVAIVQHEYGIYGGEDGDEVIDLLKALDVPAIVILHTVPLRPTWHQRTVLEDVCALAERVVVMTETARRRLVGSYSVVDGKVVTIPHGASTAARDRWNEPQLAARIARSC